MTGWSLKRIQHEAFRREWDGFSDTSRYHSLRDGKQRQGWEWAVDRLANRMEISEGQRSAAYKFYEAQQVLLGDIPPERKGMSLRGGDETETRLERAERIGRAANAYVMGHPDLTMARRRTFDRLFDSSQPTLEQVRANGKHRLNQRETIDRIRWCCEVLANHFDGAEYPQREGEVNEKHMGVGEGWKRYDYSCASVTTAAAALEAQGLQTFVAPSGNLYARNPHEASCFQPIDQSPQITASKT